MANPLEWWEDEQAPVAAGVTSERLHGWGAALLGAVPGVVAAELADEESDLRAAVLALLPTPRPHPTPTPTRPTRRSRP
jgi:hypothetical protein